MYRIRNKSGLAFKNAKTLDNLGGHREMGIKVYDTPLLLLF
jgi:hypothetical protein